MKSYVFKVAIEPDKFEDGRDDASCPALKGCHTWGHSYEEALANIRGAIDLYVQDLLEAGQAIPVDQGTIELWRNLPFLSMHDACPTRPVGSPLHPGFGRRRIRASTSTW
jgi:predicted RNase H-like HicB family nuclease